MSQITLLEALSELVTVSQYIPKALNVKVHFKLLYLILQKALGKSRESHLNTRCQRPANRITKLCAPITSMHSRAETHSHLRTQRS